MARKEPAKEQGSDKSSASTIVGQEQSTKPVAPSVDVATAPHSSTVMPGQNVEEHATSPSSGKKSDGFFGKIFGKTADKEDKSAITRDGSSESSDSLAHVEKGQGRSAPETTEAGKAKVESDESHVSFRETVEVVEPASPKEVRAESVKEVNPELISTSPGTIQAEQDSQSPRSTDKARRPNNIARRLTAIFRQKKQERMTEDVSSQDHAAISSSEAPKVS